ncbi:MAG TPA: class I SAM-dependent methyltransferase, partial [Methyloceanibacter sp.]|nr:class I SAM-dependent methyltransferase [Methyloceanibacter sp.]
SEPGDLHGMNIHIHHFHSKGAAADEAALEQFQKQWATYQKLVNTDSLAHKEVGTILHGALKTVAKPFAFVDIACGDAGQMKRALAGTKVSHYHGIDLSEPALELAAKNLAGVPFEVELDHRDFVTALTKRPEPADAAWCGLSIHHLSTDGKLSLLEAIRGSTSGFLMIYEPSLADGEDREGYLECFRRVNRPAWNFLSADEWDQIDHHVTTCDYPETAATWLELGRKAGFSGAREIFCDPTGFYRIYRYAC